MKKGLLRTIGVIAVMALLLSIAGCSGGGGGETSSGGGGGSADSPITNETGRQMVHDSLECINTDPSETVSEDDVKLDTVVKLVKDAVEKGSKGSGAINTVIEDPDGDGSMTIAGTYEYNEETKDWSANVTITYLNWQSVNPTYSPSTYNMNGTAESTVDFNRTQKILTATLSTEGLQAEAADGSRTYTTTGTYTMTGAISSNFVVSSTTVASITVALTGPGVTDGTRTTSMTTTKSFTPSNGTLTVTSNGQSQYTAFNGLSLSATVTTTDPVEITNQGVQSGQYVITGQYGGQIVVDFPGNNQIKITINGEVAYEGDIDEFIGNDV